MTQPPYVPGQQSNQYWPPQPQAYGPPLGHPAPGGAPIKPPNPKLAFWTSPLGIICMLLIAGAGALGIVFVTDLVSGPASDNFKVVVTSCEFTGSDSLPMAKVGLSVTNESSATRSATITVEYRDGGGSRIDTDTARVSNIAPGDTVRTEESTLLDAATTSGTCRVTGIR